jgi:hypothetical protein
MKNHHIWKHNPAFVLLGNFAKINDKKLKGSTDSVAIFLFFS